MVPQCVSQIQNLEISVKEESGTGHIKVFFGGREEAGACACMGGKGVLLMVVSSFWPRFDVSGTAPALTVLSAMLFLIFMEQIRREGKGVERRFLVKQKANLQLRQFSPRLFLLFGK